MARFFRRSKKKEAPAPSLPADFAQNLSVLESEMAVTPSLHTLRTLLEQYAVSSRQTAIGFLEAGRDSQFLVYHQKMQALLAREDYQKLMEPPHLALSDPGLSSTDTLTTEESNPESDSKPPDSLDTLPQQRNAERILSEDKDMSQHTVEKVHRDLKDMHESLSIKLEERRTRLSSLRKTRTMSEEPTPPKQHHRGKFFNANFELPVTVEEREETSVRLSSTPYSDEEECDKSGGPPKRLSFESYETELERITETFVLEKLAKSSEIRKRYEAQVAELSSDNSFMKQVIQQIRLAEEQEVDAMVELLEVKRKDEIQKLRSLFLTNVK